MQLVLLGLGRVNAGRDGPRLDPWVVRGRSLCGCAELEVEVIVARLRGEVGGRSSFFRQATHCYKRIRRSSQRERRVESNQIDPPLAPSPNK